MYQNFEELANAGLEDAEAKAPPAKSFPAVKALLLAVLLMAFGGVVYFFYFHKITPTVPDSAKHLIAFEANVDGEVLTHHIDDATEFEESLQHHKKEYVSPVYRETELGAKAVPATPAPEDVEAAKLAGLNPKEELPFLIQKPVDKLKATLPKVFGEAEEIPEIAPTETPIASGFATKDRPLLAEDASNKYAGIVDAAANQATVEFKGEPADIDVEIDFIRDWSGIVLVPDGVTLSRAYSSIVSLDRVETHPIDGGRLRVWSRIRNLTSEDLTVETACEFRFEGSLRSYPAFRPSFIPGGGAADVIFVSPRNGAIAYTLMVKNL
ncbi:MAG: hypothetical protein ACPGSB_11215 [Opitutales bacterium]